MMMNILYFNFNILNNKIIKNKKYFIHLILIFQFQNIIFNILNIIIIILKKILTQKKLEKVIFF